MNAELIIIFSALIILAYYIARLIIFFMRSPLRVKLHPVQHLEDPTLGHFELKMEESDDWEWSTTIVIRGNTVELRVNGAEAPDTRILENARKAVQSIDIIADIVESASRKWLHQELKSFQLIRFPSPELPHLLWVEFIGQDDKEYVCTLDSDKDFTVFATPSPS